MNIIVEEVKGFWVGGEVEEVFDVFFGRGEFIWVGEVFFWLWLECFYDCEVCELLCCFDIWFIWWMNFGCKFILGKIFVWFVV